MEGLFSFVYQHEEASKVTGTSEEKVILQRKLLVVGCCWGHFICLQQIVKVLMLFTKQKERSNLKSVDTTLDFTEDSKSRHRLDSTLLLLQAC